MKLFAALLAGGAALSFGATAASADCAEELAQLSAGATGSSEADAGISKDGSLAPLQTEAEIGGDTDAAAGEMAGGATGMAGGAEAGSSAGADTTATAEGGISKDGSLAPLQTEADAQMAGGGGAGADAGATGGTTAVATSGQDAQAQQEGAGTAAEQAGVPGVSAGGETPARTAALDRARAALEAGDEEACMTALEEARSL